jgi:hypothetical protein
MVEARHLDSDNWYDDLEIDLKNTSTKRIYFVLAYLDFPDVPVPDGVYGVSLDFGADKNIDYRRTPDPDDPYLKPGDTLTWTIPESFRKGLKRHDETLPSTMKKLELHLSVISFGDGTGFVAERFRDRKIKNAHARSTRQRANHASELTGACPGRLRQLRSIHFGSQGIAMLLRRALFWFPSDDRTGSTLRLDKTTILRMRGTQLL